MVAAPAVHVAPCPSAATAARLPLYRPGRSMRVDLDGDGSADRVVIRYDAQAATRCAFFVVYELRTRTLVARLPLAETQTAAAPASYTAGHDSEPEIALSARVRPGSLDTVVHMGHGASDQVEELFGIVDGRLRPLLSFDVGGFAAGGSWSYACAAKGSIVRRWVGPTIWDGSTYRSWGWYEETYAVRHRTYARVARRSDDRISEAEAERRYAHWLDEGPNGLRNCAVKYA